MIIICQAQAITLTFDVANIREQRRNGLWGDAMRAPAAYPLLCGFEGTQALLQRRKRAKEEEEEEEGEQLNVRVAMLQMKPPANKAVATATAEDFVRRAAAGGADIALTPEMWNVGWDAAWPHAFAPPPGYLLTQSTYSEYGVLLTYH